MSELRQDLVSGDWIIMAPERSRRPHTFDKGREPRKPAPKSSCPFENLKESGNWPPILSYPSDKDWEAVLLPNKYPALMHDHICAEDFKEGPYHLKSGAGAHDILVTRDHNKNFGWLALDQAARVFLILQERYRMLAKDKCLVYTSAFFNWGATAGATVYHPHYQVLTLPILPSDLQHSLIGLERYFRKHRKCAHCLMIQTELKDGRRIVDENKYGVVIAPFVSRQPFELRVFPKRHISRFEKTPLKELRAIAAMLQSAIKRVSRRLGDPDFNFFIHTSPLKDERRYRYYHWHIEVIPKITMLGGFELSTGVDINVADPDKAAMILRGRV